MKDDKKDNFQFEVWALRNRPSIAQNKTMRESIFDAPEEVVVDMESQMRQRSQASEFSEASLSQEQSKILSSLVPDLVLDSENPMVKKMNPFVAVLLFVDISGFTALSEKCASSDGGVDKLTSILNEFLGNMVAKIYNNGGDVWKFSGDSFLALWTVDETNHINEVIHHALQCALDFQKSRRSFEEFDIVLRLRVSMSAGNVIWSLIGDDFSRRHILAGPPVSEIMLAEEFCESGDVVLTASVWGHVSPIDFSFEILQGGRFIKVFRVVGYMGVTDPRKMKALGAAGRSDQQRNSYGRARFVPDLREKVWLLAALKLCILPPVMNHVDADLSLQYLAEIRMLTLMFINILPHILLTVETIQLVDNLYALVQSLVIKSGGFVEKVSLFDKNIMIITIFGMRRNNREGEIAACLDCGYDVREACFTIGGVKEVSVGIATGLTYCGVVGHPLRQEYTVIGPAVNKAARLMVAYPGQVTCDTGTYDASYLPEACFTSAPYRQLKGFKGEEKCYEYLAGVGRTLHLASKSGLLPLLGRRFEMQSFVKLIDDQGKPVKDATSLLIIGNSKEGKSRILDEMFIEISRRGEKPLMIALRNAHSLTRYRAATYIICQALNFQEKYISFLKGMVENLVSEYVPAEDMAYVGQFFEITTLEAYDTMHYHSELVSEKMKKIFHIILSHGLRSPIVTIDDVDLCDVYSWQLIMYAVQMKSKLFLMTRQTKRSLLSVPSKALKNLVTIELVKLTPHELAPLACQHFHAQAVHREVVELLHNRSHGNPGWCKSVLTKLVDHALIEVKENSIEKVKYFDTILPPPQLLEPTSIPELYFQNSTILQRDKGRTDETDFSYRNFHRTIEMVLQQGWWLSREKFVSTVDRRDSLFPMNKSEDSSDSSTHSGNELEKMSESSTDWAVFFKEEFTGGKYSKEIQPSSLVIELNKTYDEYLIEESMEEFLKMKRTRNLNQSANQDLRLDMLKKDRGARSSMNWSRRGSQKSNLLNEFLADDKAPNGIESNLKIHELDKTIINVVVSTADKNLNEIDIPGTYVGLISTFDSLRPFEQLVLKCGSVAGLKFTRPTLDAILHNPDTERTTASIKHLFEMKILYCTLSGREAAGKFCFCPSVRHFIGPNFPSYAFCQNLGFIQHRFRTIVYTLIPPNQQRIFHERAVEFLEGEKKICSYCQLQVENETRISRSNREMKVKESFDVKEVVYQPSKLQMLHLVLLNESIRDMNHCFCGVLQNEELEVLIAHCVASGSNKKRINFMLESVGILVSLNMPTEAKALLKSVTAITKDSTTDLTSDERRCIMASIEYLRAEILFDENIEESFAHARTALAYLFFPYRSKVLLHLGFINLKNNEMSLIAGRIWLLFSKLYLVMKNLEEARSSCLMCLRVLQKQPKSIRVLSNAYINICDIELLSYNTHFSQERESLMLQLAVDLTPIESVSNAAALGSLSYSICIRRLFSTGELLTELDLLKGIQNLCGKIPCGHAAVKVNIDLILLYIFVGDIASAAKTLLRMKDMEEMTPLIFQSLCLDFVDLTGFWVLEPDQLIKNIIKELDVEKNQQLRQRAALSVAVWMLYTNPPEAPKWLELAAVSEDFKSPCSLADVINCVFQFQALLFGTLQKKEQLENVDLKRIVKYWNITKDNQILVPFAAMGKALVEYKIGKRQRSALEHLEEASRIAYKQGNHLIIVRTAATKQAWRNNAFARPTEIKSRHWTKWRRQDWAPYILRLQ